MLGEMIYVREMIKHYTTQSLRKSLIWEILLELQGMFSRLRWVTPCHDKS